MQPLEKKALEAIHRLFLDLEKSCKTDKDDFSSFGLFDLAKLNKLKQQILELAASENPDVSRLSSIEKHLGPQMTLKHFVSFAIPFERLLHKTLQDDNFLISTEDQVVGATEKFPLVFILDNIRSAFNVGSMFRTAECLGAEKLFLCGYTPLPTQWKVEKTAMGTDAYLPWEEAGKLTDCIEHLKSHGYRIVALETVPSATDLYSDFIHQATAFILGNERFGIDPEVLKLVDEIRVIPLHGRKNSLNVGITAAIAGFEWVRQWKKN